MEFIKNASYKPGAPDISRVASERFLGLDASLSEDEISLSRADGVSYFESETEPDMAGVQTPGALNMVRTSIGEVGKRRGKRKHKALDFEGEGELVTAVKALPGETCVFTYSQSESMLRVYIFGRRNLTESFELGNYSIYNLVVVKEVLYGFLSGGILKLWFDEGGSTQPAYRARLYKKNGVEYIESSTTGSDIDDFKELYIPTITAGGARRPAAGRGWSL